MSIGKLASVVLGVVMIAVLVFLFSPRGYGEVSPDAYEVSKALYGACLAESDERLEAIDVRLSAGSDVDPESSLAVSETERRWLESMISTARNGDWKSAARSARRMMEDQVKY
ncbi:hypothetical protein [Mariniblastus fucicola]|uniref:Uncharacterized protein n=1 Tax=Mariniblastus fucicola TaxID=980251 RepID=A0A5B9PBV0_9BACT|nr:hypothetical protein [Mariniblastus fucicola]QEG23744.1 hypothetical protein MFFC18_36460 [Mariniblastus fucicola]